MRWWRPLHTAWIAALLGACSSSPTPTAITHAEPPQSLISAPGEQRRYALILPEHGLSAAPRPDAMVIAPRWGGERGRGEALGLFRLVRHMGEHHGWVALETIPRGEEASVGSCYETMSALGALRLRLYAPREALATVTAQRLTQQHPDGTRVELAAGVALIADAQDETRWIAALNDLMAPVRLMRGQLATSFSAQPLDPLTPPEDTRPPRQLAPDAFAQKRVTLQGQPLTRAPAGKNMFRAAGLLYDPQQREGAWFGTLIQPCARLTVRVEEAGLAEATGGLSILGGLDQGGIGDRRAKRIKAGTRLYWADGRPAGEVVHHTALSSVSVSPDKLTECFAIHPQLPTTVCIKHDE
jgi:hypothetical protein